MSTSRRDALRQLVAGLVAGGGYPSLARGWSQRENRVDGAGPADAGRPGPLRLDRNENAYGPSERVLEALRAGERQANRYPEAEAAVSSELAAKHAVSPEQIVLGCGSTEILRLASAAFLGPGKKLVLAVPTFEAVAKFGHASKAAVVGVPLRKNYSHDVEAMLARVDGSTGLVYICNPNNPTGTLTQRQEIERFIHRLPAETHILIDEAYHEYARGSGAYASFIDDPVGDRRVIVSRTFSTVYGLAGLRIGYAVASEQVALQLAAQRLPFSVNGQAIVAASAALKDTAYVAKCAARNTNDRQEFFNQVNARMLRVLDSHTNFALLNVARPAKTVIEYYRRKNVMLAPPIPSMPTYVRVSLGTENDMTEFWRVWDLFSPHGMSM